MSVQILCPTCGLTCLAGDELAGKLVRCPNGHVLRVPAAPSMPPSPPPAGAGPEARPRDDGDVARPARRTARRAPGSPKTAAHLTTPPPATRARGARTGDADPDGEELAPRRSGGVGLAGVLAGLIVLLLVVVGGGLTAWALLTPSPNEGQHAQGGTPGGPPQTPPADGRDKPPSPLVPSNPPQDPPPERPPSLTPQDPTDNGAGGSGGKQEGTPGGGSPGQEKKPGGEQKPPPPPVKPAEGTAGAAGDPKPVNKPEQKTEPVASAGGNKRLLSTLDFLDENKLDVKPLAPRGGVSPSPTPPVWDGHTNHVRCVAFTHDGKFVISVSGDITRDVERPADNSIRVWDVRSGQQVHKREGFIEALNSLSVSRGGRFALFSHGDYWDKDHNYHRTKDYGVYMWDIQAKRVIGSGTDILAGASSDAKGGATDSRFRGLSQSVFSTAIAPDSETVAGAAADGGLILWETKTGSVKIKGSAPPIKGFVRGVGKMRFTPDGRLLALPCADYTLRVYRTSTGEPVFRPLESHQDIIWAIDVTQTRDGHTWALTGGGWRQRRDGKGHEPGARDYEIRLWDLDQGKVVRRFKGHTDPVQELAFCPGGRQFVSGGVDKTVRLWDLESGKQLRVLGQHEGFVESVAVAPDGRSCVSGGRDCKVRFWRLPSVQDLVEALDRDDVTALGKAVEDMDVIGRDARAAFPKLLKKLGRADAEFGRLVTRVLLQLEELSGPGGLPFERDHVKDLVKALEGAGAPESRALAARGLGAVGAGAREGVPVLVKVLQGKEEAPVAAAAVEALGRIGVKNREVVEALQKALEHEDATVRARSLLALGRLGSETLTVDALLARWEKDTSPEVQAAAEKALRERLRAVSVKDLPGLRKGLKARNARVCVCCAEAAAALKAEGAGAIPEILVLLKRPEEQVRVAALRALKAVAVSDKSVVPHLVKAVEDGGDGRTVAAATAALFRIDPGNQAIVRRGVRALLEDLKPQSVEEARAALAEPLQRESARTLVEIGEPAVLPLIEQGLKGWLPRGKVNKDLVTTVARYRAYKVLEEITKKAAGDETLRQTLLRREEGLKLGYVGKEAALARQANQLVLLGAVEPKDSAVYSQTAEAARAAHRSIAALRGSGSAK